MKRKSAKHETHCSVCHKEVKYSQRMRHPETHEMACVPCQRRAIDLMWEKGYQEPPSKEFDPAPEVEESYLRQVFMGKDESWRERIDRLDKEIEIITTFVRGQ